MISLSDYLGKWQYTPVATPLVVENAGNLLPKVNALLARFEAEGGALCVNPHTGTLVSGAGLGGIRPPDCEEGAANSSHKVGRGVDVYDPHGALDKWLTDELLAIYGLYREHPEKTDGWVHLTDRPPPSKKRTFWP